MGLTTSSDSLTIPTLPEAWLTARPLERLRFHPDPRRPYLARAGIRVSGRQAFLKSYDLTEWAGTSLWRERVRKRCAMIAEMTEGWTDFVLAEERLIRISFIREHERTLGRRGLLSHDCYGQLRTLLGRCHARELVHGDVTPRNVVMEGYNVRLIDWEPILIGPSVFPAVTPVPNRVPHPTRWLGGCDLLRNAPDDVTVFQLDLIGLDRLAARCEPKIFRNDF